MADKGARPKRAYLAQWALKTNVPLAWLESGEVPNPPDGPGEPGDREEALRQLAASKRSRHAGNRATPEYGAAA